MHNILLIVFVHVGILQQVCSQLHNYGNKFYLGALKNYESGSTSLWLMVFTNSTSDNVLFHVEAPFFSTSANTSSGNPVTIDLPINLVVDDSSFLHRSKVVLFNWEDGTVGEYLGLPCSTPTKPLSLEYVYFTVSTRSVQQFPPTWSEALLVGCQRNTTITITPAVSLMLPINPQISYSPDVTVGAGQNHTFTINEGQTLYFGKPDSDITGTRIVSNKPLTVVSGHECGNVPYDVLWCEHLMQQIPPTFTWGRYFLLVPFQGRQSGQYYKLVTANDLTSVTFTCNDTNPLHVNIESQGGTHSFFASSYTYCHLFADKPVLLVQLATGAGDSDSVGDPVMIQVQPIEQYSHNLLEFSSFDSDVFAKSYISITTNKHFKNILYDGQPLNGVTWTTIFDSYSHVVGYGCHLEVGSGVHTITHSNGVMSVLLYGFHDSVKRGYGYPVGVRLNPTDRGIDISFTANEYVVYENHTNIVVGLESSYFITSNTSVLVKTIAKSAKGGMDYQELNEEIVFDVGENDKQVTIIINNDEWVESPEQFSVIILAEGITSERDEIIITIIDDDSIIASFMSGLVITDRQKISLFQGIQEGLLQPGVSVILSVQISLLQEEMLYSASHNVNFTYYVTSNEIYFNISHILPEGTHIKPDAVITAILSEELNDVNIIMRENSLSQEIFASVTSLQEITSTFTKLSSSSSYTRVFSSIPQQIITSCLLTTVTVTSTISQSTISSNPTIVSEETLTGFNFISVLSIILASAAIIFVLLLLLIMITVIYRYKRRVNNPPSAGVTNPYQIPVALSAVSSDDGIYEVPVTDYDDKYYEDMK